MKILFLHNILWSPYRSIIFEKLYHSKEDIFVLQSAINEGSRIDYSKIDLDNFEYQYPYQVICKTNFENRNQIKILLSWIRTILVKRPKIVVFTGYNEIFTLPVILLCKFLSIKVAMYLENGKIEKPVNSISIKHFYKSVIIRSTEGFICFGNKSIEFLYQFKSKRKLKIGIGNTLGNADIPSIIQRNSSKQLIFIGRLIKEKNFPFLLDIFEKLKKIDSEYTLKIIGSGPEEIEIKKIIEKKKLFNVELVGAKENKEVLNLIQESKALILSSSYEQWGLVANEAVRFNKPVIITDNCGAADDIIIDRINGFIIRDKQYDEKELHTYLSNFPIDDTFNLNNNKIFSLDYILVTYKRFFKELLINE